MEGQSCKRCGEWKELKEFHKVKDCVNGRRPICKKCVNKERNLKLETDPELRKQVNQQAIENRRKRIEKDPTWRKKENAWGRKSHKKIRSDPAKLQRERELANIRNREKYANDEEYREMVKAKAIEFFQTERGKEIKSELMKKYRRTEKGRETAYKSGMKRRSKKVQVSFKPHERKRILERDNYTCQKCGIKVHDRRTGDWNTPDKAHIDHIVTLEDGGNSEPKNLWILCRTCNLSKGSRSDKQLDIFDIG